MKKLYFPLIYLFISISVSAQSVQIGIGGGSTIVTSSDFYKNKLNGTLVQKYFNGGYTLHANSGLDFNLEYNIDIKSRLLFKKIPLCLSTEISYNSLTGKGTVTILPDPLSSYLPPPQKAESSCHLLNGCFGIEYELLSKNIIPFLSGGIVLSHLGDIKVESIEDDTYESKIQDGGIRLGLDFGTGIYFKCYPKVLVGVSTKYTMNNLIGRKEAEENINTIKTNLNVLYKL